MAFSVCRFPFSVRLVQRDGTLAHVKGAGDDLTTKKMAEDAVGDRCACNASRDRPTISC
jgi:hypothetical protein